MFVFVASFNIYDNFEGSELFFFFFFQSPILI